METNSDTTYTSSQRTFLTVPAVACTDFVFIYSVVVHNVGKISPRCGQKPRTRIVAVRSRPEFLLAVGNWIWEWRARRSAKKSWNMMNWWESRIAHYLAQKPTRNGIGRRQEVSPSPAKSLTFVIWKDVEKHLKIMHELELNIMIRLWTVRRVRDLILCTVCKFVLHMRTVNSVT